MSVRAGKVTGEVEILSLPHDRCTVCKAVATEKLAGKAQPAIPDIESSELPLWEN